MPHQPLQRALDAYGGLALWRNLQHVVLSLDSLGGPLLTMTRALVIVPSESAFLRAKQQLGPALIDASTESRRR